MFGFLVTGQVNRLSGSVKGVRNSEIIPNEFNGEESSLKCWQLRSRPRISLLIRSPKVNYHVHKILQDPG
jgi:hypothetical protein